MGAESRNRCSDAVIAALAAGQEGLLRRGDLLRLGLGTKAIDHRVRTSRLHRQPAGRGLPPTWLANAGDGVIAVPYVADAGPARRTAG